MYRISELAKRAGLARSTLLYYEKLGLIQGRRADNGYRYYDDRDLQQLMLLQTLHQGGLSLKECQQLIEQGMDQKLLQQRLAELDREIARKQQARSLLAALLGQDSEGMRAFHQQLEKIAPQAHANWLQAEGLDETGIFRLRWISRDLHNHEDYMKDFETIFAGVDRHGPGTDKDTLWALEQVEPSPERILDIGCGAGSSALLLAQHSQAQVVGLDNFDQSLQRLEQLAAERGLGSRMETCNASMTDIPFPPESFDLLWSEGSAYIMGFEQALTQWRPLLKDQGYLVISELVWLDEPDTGEMGKFWQAEYPDMQTAQARIEQCQQQGYQVVASRMLDQKAWFAYTKPLAKRLDELEPEMPGSKAIADLRHEITILEQFEGSFSYMLLVLKKSG